MGLTTNAHDACLHEIDPLTGMQVCYLVLSEEERARGFIRPVRRSYVHVTCGTTTRMGEEIAETYARDPTFYGGTYCAGCKTHFSLFTFVDGPLDDADRAAGRTLHKAGQFQWDGTDEWVGT